jgi:hypothetical protein
MNNDFSSLKFGGLGINRKSMDFVDSAEAEPIFSKAFKDPGLRFSPEEKLSPASLKLTVSKKV